MKEPDWFSHCVPGDPDTPYNFNYHTHGLEKLFNHKNIQVVMPMNPKTIHAIINRLIEEIRQGTQFLPNQDYENLMADGYKVRFIEAKECGRDVLRLLIPDKEGKYEGEYADQLTMLDNWSDIPVEEQRPQKD